jgi:glycosyltransferase involved in cell wall biosynthesis
MRENYLPKDQRKKILLISDDLRLPSGVGTMSRELVIGTAHKFNWVQIAAAVQHPEHGKVLDASESLATDTGVPDAYLHLFPSNGYGDIQTVRNIINFERPDALMLFTDPRYFIWLFYNEHELRQLLPITYLNIWDDLPFPMYNELYYRSVDSLFAISRQTYNINKVVLGERAKDKVIKYVPHGINPKYFYPITSDEDKTKLTAFKQQLFNGDDVEFAVLYNNRNIRRKMTGDVVLAYREFLLQLPVEQQSKCRLVLHTQPVDDNGTDLPRLIRDCAPEIKVIFSQQRIDTNQMNLLYNACDVCINLASNEGFGLATAEAMMVGKVIIANVTGGLQDQMGFSNYFGEYLTEHDFSKEWGTNADGKYREHGNWAFPVFPAQRALIGSPPTPYIFDDRCRWEDAAKEIRKVFDMKPEERQWRGEEGRQYMLTQGFSAEAMCAKFIEGMDETFTSWTPRERFELLKA